VFPRTAAPPPQHNLSTAICNDDSRGSLRPMTFRQRSQKCCVRAKFARSFPTDYGILENACAKRPVRTLRSGRLTSAGGGVRLGVADHSTCISAWHAFIGYSPCVLHSTGVRIRLRRMIRDQTSAPWYVVLSLMAARLAVSIDGKSFRVNLARANGPNISIRLRAERRCDSDSQCRGSDR